LGRNGGTLTNTDATVGNVRNADPGRVEVAGNASWPSSGNVSMAPIGSATPVIDSGGEVTMDGTLTLGAGATVSMSNDSGLLRAATVDNTSGATISWLDGNLSFDSFPGDLINYGGSLSPGLDPGLEWDLSKLYVSGEIAIAGAPAPLPGASWLLGSGITGLVVPRR